MAQCMPLMTTLYLPVSAVQSKNKVFLADNFRVPVMCGLHWTAVGCVTYGHRVRSHVLRLADDRKI